VSVPTIASVTVASQLWMDVIEMILALVFRCARHRVRDQLHGVALSRTPAALFEEYRLMCWSHSTAQVPATPCACALDMANPAARKNPINSPQHKTPRM
jgi:hypothetical protein